MNLTADDISSIKELAATDKRMGAWLEHWIEWRTAIARPAQICLLPEQEDKLGQVWMSGRGAGKAVCLDTQIPTSTGWTTIGNIKPGDIVFSETGQPCSVTFISYIETPEVCYRVTFSDGYEVDACADHQWFIWDKKARKSHSRAKNPTAHPRVVKTQEIYENLFVSRKDRATEVNFSIQCALPIKLQHSFDLVFDPYIFGYWLGNGHSATFDITINDLDEEFLRKKIADAGYSIRREVRKEGVACITVAVSNGAVRKNIGGRYRSNGSLHSLLKEIGVWKNKHIPMEYLRASEAQRWELLKGLMDSDGTCSEDGSVEFCVTDKRLAENTHELITSLGFKSVLTVGDAKLYGKDCGKRWRIHFTPYLPIFGTPRKLKRQKSAGRQAGRQSMRYVVSCIRIPSKPMRCISVDSPSRLFLMGRSMIPTHNTRTGAEETFAYAMLKPNSRQSIIAPTFSDARSVCVEGDSGIVAISPDGVGPASCITKWNRSIGEIEFYNNSFIQLFSAEEPNRLRGPQFHRMWAEELAAWGDGNNDALQATWDMAMFGLRLKPHPTFIVTTTPKPLPFIRELVKRKDIILTRESTYANAPNLGESFLRELKKYEGTTLGRQEIHGEIVDLEAAGIFKKEWFKLWPSGKAFPTFMYVIAAYDTAYTVKDTGSYSACSVWGIFKEPSRGDWHVLLLDCWRDHIGYPDLRKKMMENWKTSYGEPDPDLVEYTKLSMNPRPINGRKPDVMLIEKKASGQSLLQDLRNEGINCWDYNPGRDDKTMRAHMVSPVVAGGHVWIPESLRVPGEIIGWAQPFVDEVVGNNPSEDVFDWGDTFTSALSLLQKEDWLGMPLREPDDKEDLEDNDIPAYNPSPSNPYAN